MNADRRARIHFTAHSKAAGYYAAVLLATLAQIARSPLDPPTLVPFITYVPFIVLSAAYGGLGPGLLTTGLSLLEVAWFAADPVGSLRVKYGHDMVGMFALAVSGMVISYLFDRMRRALHTEEARRELAALLDHTYDAAFVWIPGNAGIQWWNHAAKRLYGYSCSDAVGKTSHELLATRFPESQALAEAALRDKGFWEGELIHTARDGRQITVQSRQTARTGADGRLRVLEVNRDITDWKKAQEQLRRESEFRALAMEAAGLGAWDYWVDGGEGASDDRCKVMFGFHRGLPVAHADALARVHPDDRAARDAAAERAFSGVDDGRYNAQYRVCLPDGTVRWLEAHGKVWFDGAPRDRRPVRLLGVTMDITERRRAEQELFEAHTELRAIHAAAPVTLLVVDEQFRVQRVSDLVSPGAAGDQENTALRPGEAIACFHAVSDSLGCGYGPSCETCAVRAAIRECIEGGAAVPAAEAWLPVVSGPGEQESRCVLISATPMRFGETRRALLCVQDMTTLRNTERQLEQQRASLLRQAELINLSHDAIITTDENRAIVTWNGGATEMYGWAEQEALGRPLHELLRTEYDRPRAEIDAVLKSDGRWQGELLHTRKDGQQIAVESRQVLVCDDGRTSTTLLEINRDITARKQAEQALAQNLERLERVLEVETVGVMFRDLNTGCIVDANDAFLKLTGYTRAEVEQRKLMWQNLTPPEYMDVSRAEIEKSMATGRVGPYEKEYFRQDGTRKWLLSAGSSLANNQCVEFCVDISDRKRAEQALRDSEQRVRRKLESVLSPEEDIGEPLELEDIIDIEALQAMMDDLYALAHLPTAILDTKGKVLVRSGWQEICTEFHRVHPDTLQHCIESDTALSTTAGPGDFKLYKCKNNLCDVATPFYVSGRKLGNIFTGQFLLDDEPVDIDLFASQAALHGFDQQQYLAALARVPRVSRRAAEQGIAFLQRFGAFIGKLSHANIKLARSLAQLQRSEDTIRRLNADLEERVQQRTAQLEASNKELEAFAYSVSHDLRAPLRGIDGWSLALLEDYGGLLNEEAREYLSRVRSETQRMGQLIDDLLQLSRLTRTEMKSEAVDLTSVARNVAERLRENNPGRDVEFAIQPGLDAVGDASLLEVAIGNLLGNAVKFTGTRAKARVEFGQTESAGSRTFYVRDNGVGFDMAYADMLFGAFQRLHKASEFPGTGIGLATVQRVIRRHGGRVWAESRPNEGATFYFIIASGSATAVKAR